MLSHHVPDSSGWEDAHYRQNLVTFLHFSPWCPSRVFLSSQPPFLLGKDSISCSQALISIRISCLAAYALGSQSPFLQDSYLEKASGPIVMHG